MPKRSARKAQRSIYASNIKKLQRAGLIGAVDIRKKATPAIVARLDKYKSVLVGKAAAVQAPDLATARRLRKTLGLKGTGRTIIVPKEKGEKYTVQKSTGEIVSTRKGYNKGETIKKTLGSKFPAQPSANSNKRLYYTLPKTTRGAGRLKRQTFASFDEMLFYLSKYEINFNDIEDHIEIEEITRNGRADKTRINKINLEREAGRLRTKRRKAREGRAATQKRNARSKRRGKK